MDESAARAPFKKRFHYPSRPSSSDEEEEEETKNELEDGEVGEWPSPPAIRASTPIVHNEIIDLTELSDERLRTLSDSDGTFDSEIVPGRFKKTTEDHDLEEALAIAHIREKERESAKNEPAAYDDKDEMITISKGSLLKTVNECKKAFSGIRPNLAKSRFGSYVQYLSSQCENYDLRRLFHASLSDVFHDLVDFPLVPIESVDLAVTKYQWTKRGALFPVFSIDSNGNYNISDLMIWVK